MSIVAARHLDAGHLGQPVVRDLDLEVAAGEIVALLGPNGAGKTTTLLTLAGDLPAIGGEVLWRGAPTTARLHRRARNGLALITEERSVIKALSVRDNLLLGGVLDEAVAVFPELERLLDRRAGLLSGGEQQMLTVGRAIARAPSAILADELSLGLAPQVVDRLLAELRRQADAGVAVLLVEQHARKALQVADRVYVMRRGRVELQGTAEDLRGRLGDIARTYLSSNASNGSNGSNGTNQPLAM